MGGARCRVEWDASAFAILAARVAAWFLLRVTALMAVQTSRIGLAQLLPVALSLLAAAGCMAAQERSDALRGDGPDTSGQGGSHAISPEPHQHAGTSSGNAAGTGWGQGGVAGAGNAGGTSGDPGGAGGAPPAEPPDLPREPQLAPGDVIPGCIDKGATTLFLSADDSNSQASPVVVRSLIAAGRHVPQEAIRTYEFLNYADFDYPAPLDGLALYPELRPSRRGGKEYDLQLGVRAPDLARAAARPMNLVLVLDSSGSMAGRPIELLRSGVEALIGSLRAGDRVSAVRFSGEAEPLLRDVPAESVDVADLLARLTPDGVTDIDGALGLAYELADAVHYPGALTRVVLFSDGGANAGVTTASVIAAHAGAAQEEGIYFAGVGLGEGFNDSLMNVVTDAGKGAYVVLDSPEEAARVFGERFVSTFELAALDVQVKLVLPPKWALVEFHGEEVSSSPNVVRPQNLAPSDQMIFHQLIGTCPSGVVSGEEELSFTVSYTEPLTGARREVTRTVSIGALLAQPADNLTKGNALVALAEGLKELYAKRRQPAAAGRRCDELVAALAELAGPASEATEALSAYCPILRASGAPVGACDCGSAGFAEALGLCGVATTVTPGFLAVGMEGTRWGGFTRLGDSEATVSREGCKMAALSTGRVGERETSPGLAADVTFADPAPAFSGAQPTTLDGAKIKDLTQLTLTLEAPADAQSFSFDFDFFSAEYPDYIGSQFNDTFYAILRAPSTNGGAPTNISFDGVGRSIEINNNYFANAFHPCSEAGTGFVTRASTCWLRTSWPIAPGEKFTLTFSIHDEGDAIYSSTVLLDHFAFHAYPAVGMTDPLN